MPLKIHLVKNRCYAQALEEIGEILAIQKGKEKTLEIKIGDLIELHDDDDKTEDERDS